MLRLVTLCTLLASVAVCEEEYDCEYCTSCHSPEGSAPRKELSSCASSHAVCQGHDEGVQE